MKTVSAQQGDTIDLICHRHFGTTIGITEQVYAQNPGLAAHGFFIPNGTKINLPDIAEKQQQPSINLWD